MFVRLLFGLAVFTTTGTAALAEVAPAELADRLEEAARLRPRLLLLDRDLPALRARLEAEPGLRAMRQDLLAAADQVLATAPVKRVLTGRRLLGQSRTALARVLQLGLAWRLTEEPRYLDRATAELEAIAAFNDWNPSHFLDVAEMTAAAAVGYDWLHAGLAESTRTRLRQAIVEKGLRPSLEVDHWTRTTNNWNPVCNAGMVLGALAVAEDEPALATELIARAINTVPLALAEYAPDGAYPEGASYWSYGTSFTVLLISALEGALGSDFDLAELPGFLATADYYLHVTGPTGLMFNYADAFEGSGGRSPAMPWFALRRGAPYLLWHELGAAEASRADERLFPLSLIWLAATPGLQRIEPKDTWWSGGGVTPVAFHRTGWEPEAGFLAIKGGSAATNHAHMDAGSFVYDAGGVRWAHDLGAQDYHSLESAGVNLWDREQEGDRWTIFRLGTSSHNVLQVDGQPQRVAGHAPILLSRPDRTVVDLTEVYAGQLAGARRGVRLRPDRGVWVQDEYRTRDQPADVRWAMLTQAEVTIDGPGAATLRRGDASLRLRVLEPGNVRLEIFPTDPPPRATDARNPNTRMIGFKIRAAAGQEVRSIVHLALGTEAAGNAAEMPDIAPLDSW